jgi:hypothetical protein
MDKFTKVWQIWNRTKINRLECDTHKNIRANRIKLQTNNEKTKSNKKRVQSRALWSLSAYFQQERKTSFLERLLISKRNCKWESAVKVVANGVHTAKLATESHLRRRKRKRLALIAADVCECTKVQCTIQRVQPDRGHHCGSKHKRYDSTGILTVK